MPRSDWGIVGAALVALAIMASAAGLWLYSDTNRLQLAYEHRAEQSADEYAQRAYVRIQRICASMPLPDKQQCIREESQIYRDGQRNEYDLEAQLVTSAWTRSMGIAAIIGMVASLIGVGLVLITFRATRHANDIAKDTAKQQLRAYVGIQEILADLSQTYNNWRLSVVWVNAGQTPAYNVISGFHWKVGTAVELNEFDFPDQNRLAGVTSIAPGQTLVSSTRETLSLDRAREILKNRVHAVCWGWIEYSDTYPDSPRRRTECAFTIGIRNISHVPQVEIGFLSHNKHNGMDDNCMHPAREWDSETNQPKDRT